MNGEFIDVVKPTFTYQYSNTVIDHDEKEEKEEKEEKKVTIVFDATDKFFSTIDDNEKKN